MNTNSPLIYTFHQIKYKFYYFLKSNVFECKFELKITIKLNNVSFEIFFLIILPKYINIVYIIVCEFNFKLFIWKAKIIFKKIYEFSKKTQSKYTQFKGMSDKLIELIANHYEQEKADINSNVNQNLKINL